MLSEPPILELLVRGGAVGAFVGLALAVGRGSVTPARITGVLFCLAAAAHTLTQLPVVEASLGIGHAPVWALSVMGAGFFWAFAVELFEDSARLDWRRFGPAAALLVTGVLGAVTPTPVARILWLAHNLGGAALIIHAIVLIGTGWRGDLVEPRRRLRGPVLATAAIYALAVLLVQTGELFAGSASGLSPLAAVSLLSLALLSLWAFGRVDPVLFGAPVVAPGEVALVPPDPLEGDDAKAAGELDRLMKTERLYREGGLTIASLALRLRLPEHRLRRLINQRLGHRNFNAFLNQRRLGEAKEALADPTQNEVPISTIALDAGFQSLGPFNRAFKTETGLTPTEFRARVLADANRSSSRAARAST